MEAHSLLALSLSAGNNVLVLVYNALYILDMLFYLILCHGIYFQKHCILQPCCYFFICQNVIIQLL